MKEEKTEDFSFEFNPEFIENDGTEGKQEVSGGEKPNDNLDLFDDKIFDKAEPEKNKDDKEKDIKKNAPSPDDIIKDENSSSSDFSVVLGQDLMERGVLSTLDEEKVAELAKEKGDAAAIMFMLEEQAKAINDELKESNDASYNEYITMVKGGVPKEEAVGIQKIEAFSDSLKDVDLKSDDEQSVAARKDLLTLNYRLTTKWSDDKINKYIDKLYEAGADIDEIEESQKNVSDYIVNEKQAILDAAKQRQEEAQTQKEKIESSYKDYIKKTDEFFHEDKVPDDIKKKMEKIIFTPTKLKTGTVSNQVWAEREKNPVAFDSKIAYLMAIGFFGDKPLEIFTNKARTKETTRLQEYLNDNKGRSFSSSLGNSFSQNKSKSKDFFDDL